MMHLGVYLRADKAVELTGHLKVFVQLYRADFNNFGMENAEQTALFHWHSDSILSQIQCSSS